MKIENFQDSARSQSIRKYGRSSPALSASVLHLGVLGARERVTRPPITGGLASATALVWAGLTLLTLGASGGACGRVLVILGVIWYALLGVV